MRRVLKEDRMLCFGTEVWHVVGEISLEMYSDFVQSSSRVNQKMRGGNKSQKRSRHFKSIITEHALAEE